MADEISRHVAHLISPMCSHTARLLREEKDLRDTDRVHVSVEDDAYDAHDGESVALFTKRFRFEFKSSDPNNSICSHWLRRDWWFRVPGAQRITHGAYGFTAPPTDVTALVVLAAVGPDKLAFDDEIARLEFWSCALRFAQQVRGARAQAGFKQHRTVPNRSPRGNGHTGQEPMPHQRVAAYCATRAGDGYALFMEQSTGKTYTTIMAIESVRERGECQACVIVCPKNVRTNWAIELDRFSKLRTAVFKLFGGRVERSAQLLEAFRAKISGDFDVVYVILSYQMLVNSQAQVCAYPWDWAVIDEAHFAKWHRAQRTRACLKLRDRARRRLALTGTPIANQVFDLYTQLEFLGRGWSGFTSFDAFRRFHGTWEPMGRGVERLLSLRNIPLLQERLARCSFLIRKSEALPDLPAKTYDLIEVEMSGEQREVYAALASQLYAEIEHEMSTGKVTVTNVLTKLLRLSQVTSGFVTLDKQLDPETDELLPGQIDRFDPNPKIEQLMELVKSLDADSKAIIWSCYVQDVRQVAARLRLEGYGCVTYYGATSDADREAAVTAFNNDPATRFIVGNPAAGGVGLNLTGYCGGADRCDTVIFYAQNWSSVTRAQGEERPRGFIPNTDVKWSVRCVDLCVADSIDIEIRQRVTDKRWNAAKIQDVRGLLKALICHARERVLEE